MKKIVLFASGSGSNAEKIMQYFSHHPSVRVAAVLSNKNNAAVLDKAKNFQVPTVVFTKEELENRFVLNYLQDLRPDLIVLAGFLWKFPKDIIDAFSGKIINIHPALLPAYGGKGMYGMNVHLAVMKDKAAETGITIHYINEFYDQGAVIFQDRVSLSGEESPEDVATKVLELEHANYAKVIEQILN